MSNKTIHSQCTDTQNNLNQIHKHFLFDLLSDFALYLFRLTQTLQKLSLREKSNPLLVQPNMAVQSLKGQTPIKQVQLTSFKGEFVLILKLKYTTELSRNPPTMGVRLILSPGVNRTFCSG